MTSLESLELPEPIINALLKAGLGSVEDLCVFTPLEVGGIDGIRPRIECVREIRGALGKLGLDLRQLHDDPVGEPNFPSRIALRGLFDRLDLMPATRKVFTWYLLKAILPTELLAQIDPEDHGKIVRLLDLIDECQGR